MGVGDIHLRKFDICRLYVAVRRPFSSRREYQWLTIKNRSITVLAKDDVLRESGIAQRDPSIAHSAPSFRNSVIEFSIIPNIPNVVSFWIMTYGPYTTQRLSLL